MNVIRTIVLDKTEAHAVAEAQHLIDIAYPSSDGPLLAGDPDAAARAVASDDPHRRVLRGLAHNDLITWPRLVLAQEVLAALGHQVAVESEPEHWLALAPDAQAPLAVSMSAVLAESRLAQQSIVEAATRVVSDALGALSPADDLARLREEDES